MRDILSATACVGVRRLGYVVVVAIGIALPGAILVEAPGDEFGFIATLGAGVTLLASVTLVLVLVRDLQSRQLALASIVPSVVSATVRTIGASLILAALSVVPLILGTVLIVSLVDSGSAVAVEAALIALVSAYFAPLSLVVPVCLNEDGGPWWALNRAWAISRPRRWQARLLLGGLLIPTFGASWLLRGFGPAVAPSVALIVLNVASTVVAAGFLAVLYERLTREPPATTNPAP